MKSLRLTAVAICVSTASLMLATFGNTATAADALGTWFTGEKESQVRIVNCGGALCGNLVWLKEPNDPATGRPKTDKNNADASKQISHITFFGTPGGTVPDSGTTAMLFGSALTGLGFARRYLKR